MNPVLLKSSIYFILFSILCNSCQFFEKKEDKNLPKDPIARQIALYSDSILESPRNARLYYERANLYWKKGEMELALQDFYNCNTYDSTNPTYYATIADFMLQNGNPDRAIMAMEKAIQFAPENPVYHMLAGKYNLYLKKYQATIDHLNNALKKEPTFPDAYFYKGYAYKEMGNTEKAISNLMTATEQNPQWDEPYEILGNIFAEKKDPKCIQYYDNAVLANPKNTSARLSKAYFYKSIGKKEESLKAYEAIVSEFPQNVDAIYSIGILNFDQQKYDLAYKQFEICKKVEPQFPDSYFMQGKIEKIRGNKTKAKELFKQALIFDPEFEEAKKEMNSL